MQEDRSPIMKVRHQEESVGTGNSLFTFRHIRRSQVPDVALAALAMTLNSLKS